MKSDSIIFSLSHPPLNVFIPILLKKFKKFEIMHNIQDLYPDIFLAFNKNIERKIYYKLLHKCSQIILNKSDHLIIVGKSMIKKLKMNYIYDKNKIDIIENWALKEIENYQPKKRNRTKSNNILKILYSGTIGRSHEYETILQCAKKLQDKNITNIEFIISGGGYNYCKFKEVSKELNNIEFNDYVDIAILPKIIETADICLTIGKKELNGIIVPSKFYGFVASYKPVIYINNGIDDLGNHIKSGNFGYVVPNGNYNKLFNILVDLSENKNKLVKFGNNAKKYYLKNLQRRKQLENYLHLFKRIVK